MDARPDFSRLNAAEREVLALLAEGHTAKSIAAATGRSEGAVNERLREARRKTGVGSSRELARLVRAQENRDEQIGVEATQQPAPAPDRTLLVACLIGVLVVMILIAAAALLSPFGQAEPPPRTLFQDAAGLHLGEAESWRAETRAQPRRSTWADRSEAVLRQRYAAIPGVDATSLRIDCRESKCEVVGRSAAVSSPAAVARACEPLVSPALRDSLTAHGLRGRFSNCGGFDVKHSISFLGYWIGPDD